MPRVGANALTVAFRRVSVTRLQHLCACRFASLPWSLCQSVFRGQSFAPGFHQRRNPGALYGLLATSVKTKDIKPVYKYVYININIYMYVYID